MYYQLSWSRKSATVRFRSVFTCLRKKKKRLKTKRSQKTAFYPGSVFGRFSVDDRQTQWYKQTTKSDTRISFNFNF